MEMMIVQPSQQNNLRSRKNQGEEEQQFLGFDQILDQFTLGILPEEGVTETLKCEGEVHVTKVELPAWSLTEAKQSATEIFLGAESLMMEQSTTLSVTNEEKRIELTQPGSWSESILVQESKQNQAQGIGSSQDPAMLAKIEDKLNEEGIQRWHWQGKEDASLFQARYRGLFETGSFKEDISGTGKILEHQKTDQNFLEAISPYGIHPTELYSEESMALKAEKPASESLIFSQVTQGIEKGLKAMEKGFTIRLKPAELGEITLAFEKDEGGMVLRMTASCQDTAQRLNQQLEGLREVLKPYAMQIQPVIHLPVEAGPGTSDEGSGMIFQNANQNSETPFGMSQPSHRNQTHSRMREEELDSTSLETLERFEKMKQYA